MYFFIKCTLCPLPNDVEKFVEMHWKFKEINLYFCNYCAHPLLDCLMIRLLLQKQIGHGNSQ